MIPVLMDIASPEKTVGSSLIFVIIGVVALAAVIAGFFLVKKSKNNKDK